MIRRLALLLLPAALGAAVLILILARGGTSQSYRVDVVFDDARGLVPSQLLEIAGGRAGTITAVKLTDADRRALVELDVDSRFAPFRASATCAIRPQGLIAENYVACDPGSSGPLLRGQGGQPPTVPVSHTTEPVTLTDMFNIATLPTRERLTVLLSELGLASAARGEDINAILRRANPSLALARQVIAILQAQSVQLSQTIDATDPIVSQLAIHRDQVRSFLTQAATVTNRVADHRGSLGTAVHRLPALLSATRPALNQLDTVATQGTPLLLQLKATAPLVLQLSRDLTPLVTASRPALSSLGAALTHGATVARQLTPTTKLLRSYAAGSLPTAQLTAQLFANLEQTGFFTNFLGFTYNAAAASARFDTISHILPAQPSFTPCGVYATSPVAGCSAHFRTATAARAPAHGATRAAALALLRYLLR